MIAQMKKVAGAATLATQHNGSRPCNDRNRTPIVNTLFRILAVVLLFVALGFIQRADFLPGYCLSLLAGLLLAATSEELARYYRYLRWLRRTQAAELRGYRPRGEHTGDGIPRDLAGRPFEPLSSWEGVAGYERRRS